MREDNLRYAVLGLVRVRREGVHGYRLKSEIEAICDEFWELNYGRLYRVLDLLDAAGDLAVEIEQQVGRPNRKVYRLTEKGKQTLDDWLLLPVSEEPHPLRDELALKLLFLDRSNIDALAKQISSQRAIYLRRLARVTRRRRRLEKAGIKSRVVELVMEGAEGRVRADLAWLDHIERRIIRGL